MAGAGAAVISQQTQEHAWIVFSSLSVLPRNGAAHSGLGLPTPINSQGNPPTLHTSLSDLENPPLRHSFQVILSYVKFQLSSVSTMVI